jgi:hypothetical protein
MAEQDVIARLAAACKQAEDGGDYGQHLARLETLRQNHAARHSVLSEGAERGGGAAGLGLGGGAGVLGGLAGSLRALPGSKMGLRGKLGAGAGLTALLAALGGAGGRGLGKGLGRASVGSLPGPLASPVTAESAPSVTSLLAKSAVDFDAVRANMEKTAGGFGKAVMGLGKSMFTAPQAGGAGRGLSLGRMARTAGLGAGAVAGYGHAADHAANSPESHWYNPLTWTGDHPSHEQVFQQNNAKYTEQAGGMNQQIDEALGSGDHAKAQSLQQQMDSGDFGGSFWRLGGLNPFAEQRAGVYQRRALGSQNKLQGDYNTELGKSGPQPGDSERMRMLEERLTRGDMLPTQADALTRQRDALRTRMGTAPGTENPAAKTIRDRMTASGMRFAGPKPAGGGAPSPAGGPSHWGSLARPASPGVIQGWAINPYDHRSDPYPDPLAAFGAAGGMRGGYPG